MSLLRFYYPLADLDRLSDDALAACFQPDNRRGGLFRPRMNLHTSEETNTVTATFELPGLKPEDITIDVHKDYLTVAGEASESHSHEEGGYSVRERSHGKFSRTLKLPSTTKPENVKAKMENGVLTVTFPKSNPEEQAQRITIQ